MLSPALPFSPHRRGAVVVGIAALVAALILAIAALAANVPNAGARAAREAGLSRVAHLGQVSSLSPASSLGSAVGNTALGLHTSYYQPPALADPSHPGFIVNSGPDQPDPFVYVQNGRYYLFTSRDEVPQNIPVRTATVFGQWGPPTDALPDPPAWAASNVMWAPDVAKFGDHYILYFTSQVQGASSETKCIGDAISTDPAGPYIASPVPFICQQALGGSIDPRVFVDANGQPTMIWKSDQNAFKSNIPTQIWSQALSADGTQLLGSPTVIFQPDEPWQNNIVEAPQMVLVNGAYYLFYSGGWFNQASYAIGVARCASALGPCHDTSNTPLLGSTLQGWGPGEESVFSNAVGVWMVYTPWCSSLPNAGAPRPVVMAHLGFGPDGPYLAAPLQTGSKG